MNLDGGQYRWVLAALQDLQLDQARRAGSRSATGGHEDLAVVLLARPGADSFNGRQRDELAAVFRETEPGVLRDLAMLLRADPPEQAGRGRG